MELDKYKEEQLEKLKQDYNSSRINIDDYVKKKKEIDSLEKIPTNKPLDEKTELLNEILKELKIQSEQIANNRENTNKLVNWLVVVPYFFLFLYFVYTYLSYRY